MNHMYQFPGLAVKEILYVYIEIYIIYVYTYFFYSVDYINEYQNEKPLTTLEKIVKFVREGNTLV